MKILNNDNEKFNKSRKKERMFSNELYQCSLHDQKKKKNTVWTQQKNTYVGPMSH